MWRRMARGYSNVCLEPPAQLRYPCDRREIKQGKRLGTGCRELSRPLEDDFEFDRSQGPLK